MTLQLTILSLWGLYLVLYGMYDGRMWYLSRKDASLIYGLKWHPHFFSLSMRIMMAGVLSWIQCINYLDFAKDWIALLAMLPFIFDGTYYETRKHLDALRGYHFFGMSTTSTGIIDFGPVVRIILFIMGLAVYLLVDENVLI